MKPTRHPVVAVDDLPFTILAEFDDQPGLRLTCRQVQRLWALSERECASVLHYLVSVGLLERDNDQFRRPFDFH